MQWDLSSKQTETGEIPFHYTQLSQLKTALEPEPPQPWELSKQAKMISVSQDYDTDIITLFHAAGDFNYRHRWQEGVKAVEEVSHFLPRVGTRCRCLLDNGQSLIYASSYLYQPDRIEFSETNEAEKSTAYYILEKTGDKKTRLTLDYYLQKNLARQLLFKLTQQKKVQASIRQSLQNLETLAKEIKLPDESWA
jgi:hypothetical protein